jgi:hypothetical protein
MLLIKHLVLNAFFVFLLAGFNSCHAQNSCDNLPVTYKSYTEALKLVRGAKFKFSDSYNTSKSSFITSAHYYSCDNKSGFLIIGFQGKPYIYRNVPKVVWNEFKAADSFGNFFNAKIKSNSKFKLN